MATAVTIEVRRPSSSHAAARTGSTASAPTVTLIGEWTSTQ